MGYEITLEQQREELRAEYRNSTDPKEMKAIFDELWLIELMLTALEWKAEGGGRKGQ